LIVHSQLCVGHKKKEEAVEVVGEIKGRSARPGKLPMLIDLAFPTTFDETIPSFFPSTESEFILATEAQKSG
jgi:hypothetical protein